MRREHGKQMTIVSLIPWYQYQLQFNVIYNYWLLMNGKGIYNKSEIKNKPSKNT